MNVVAGLAFALMMAVLLVGAGLVGDALADKDIGRDRSPRANNRRILLGIVMVATFFVFLAGSLAGRS